MGWLQKVEPNFEPMVLDLPDGYDFEDSPVRCSDSIQWAINEAYFAQKHLDYLARNRWTEVGPVDVTDYKP